MLNDAGTYNCTARSNGVVTTRSFQVVVEGKVWILGMTYLSTSLVC